MTTYVQNTAVYPYSAVVRISVACTDGTTWSGSGVIIGENDILTASHVVYEAGKTISSIAITPAQNGTTKPYGTVYADVWSYNQVDNDGDGSLYASESVNDYALIGVSESISSQTGTMGLGTITTSYTSAQITGYPGKYGSVYMTTASGYVYLDSSSGAISNNGIEVNSGNSGGPVWNGSSASPYVYGVVSTTGYSAPVSGTNLSTILSWMDSNDYLLDSTDDYGATISTAGAVSVGGSTTGNIEEAADTDWFAVTLTAGHTYQINLKGSDSNGGTLTDALIEGLYNASGSLISGTSDDDSGTGDDSLLTYGCTSTGTYYIAAAGYGSDTGTYTLSVTDTTTSSILYGTSGNDTFTSTAADNVIYGYEGVDTVVYGVTMANCTVTQGSSSVSVVDSTGANGSDTLYSIERLDFTDSVFVMDTGIGEIGGEAYRIYQAAFARTPDNGGLAYWLGRLDSGMDLNDVAARFIDSNEFRSTYGTNMSNNQYVDALYHNVLNRAGDSGGMAYWQSQLDTGSRSWAQVLACFSESDENVTSVAATIGNGYTYTG